MNETPQWVAESQVLRMLGRYARWPLKHPAKVRLVRGLGRMITNPVIRFAQGKGRINIDLEDYIGWVLLHKQAFEPKSLQLAVDIMNDSEHGVFLDVGAHHGLFSAAVGASTA